MEMFIKASQMQTGDFVRQKDGKYIRIESTELYSEESYVFIDFGKSGTERVSSELNIAVCRMTLEDINLRDRLVFTENRVFELNFWCKQYLQNMRAAMIKCEQYRVKCREAKNGNE